MSRDPLDDPEEDRRLDDGDPEEGLRTTAPKTLVTLALVGLVVGWAVRMVAVERDLGDPQVGWLQVLVVFFVAAILGGVAWITHRDLQRGPARGSTGEDTIAPHQAVNRLVLAKACAIAGALMAGGYLGSALSWVGIDAETADSRILRSLLAAAAAVLTVAASLLLERACRIRGGPPEP